MFKFNLFRSVKNPSLGKTLLHHWHHQPRSMVRAEYRAAAAELVRQLIKLRTDSGLTLEEIQQLSGFGLNDLRKVEQAHQLSVWQVNTLIRYAGFFHYQIKLVPVKR